MQGDLDRAASSATVASDDRHVTGATTRQLVRLVRGRAGEAGVARVRAVAGEERPAEVLEDELTWSSYGQLRRLLEAVTQVLGDPSAARHVGDALLTASVPTEVAALLRSLGSPTALLANIGAAAAKYCTVLGMEATELGPTSCVVEGFSFPGYPRYPEICQYTAGMLTQVPVLFGYEPADVVEETCESEGDERCRFRVSWRERSADAGPEAGGVGVMAARFEALQATVTDLVSIGDPSLLLNRIVGRAGAAVRAPRFVLAVRPVESGELAVHAVGMDDEEAHRVALALSEDAGREGSWLVAEVRSHRRLYGHLAALHEPHVRFLTEEAPLLSVYARLAAAALDGAAALETARREAAASNALLELARTLAEVVTVQEMADRLCRAVLDVVDCDRSLVWLWDEVGARLTLQASCGMPPEAVTMLRAMPLRRADVGGLDRMVADPSPVFVDSTTSGPVLRKILAVAGSERAVVVPISHHGRFLGVVTAEVEVEDGRLVDEPGLVRRVEGMADQAATALQNAALLDEMRLLALHDALTGLPNGRALEDAAGSALARARRSGTDVALLFVDLDGFKEVNDRFGHAAGDELLRVVGRRLAASVREGDLVARVGGDEFVVLLHVDGTAAAAEVATDIRRRIAEPFDIGDRISVGASVGLAVSAGGQVSFEHLLRDADADMYETKRRRR